MSEPFVVSDDERDTILNIADPVVAGIMRLPPQLGLNVTVAIAVSVILSLRFRKGSSSTPLSVWDDNVEPAIRKSIESHIAQWLEQERPG